MSFLLEIVSNIKDLNFSKIQKNSTSKIFLQKYNQFFSDRFWHLLGDNNKPYLEACLKFMQLGALDSEETNLNFDNFSQSSQKCSISLSLLQKTSKTSNHSHKAVKKYLAFFPSVCATFRFLEHDIMTKRPLIWLKSSNFRRLAGFSSFFPGNLSKNIGSQPESTIWQMIIFLSILQKSEKAVDRLRNLELWSKKIAIESLYCFWIFHFGCLNWHPLAFGTLD